MPGDLPGAHAARVHGYDLVIKAGETALVLRDQLRLEPRLTVARDIDLQLAGICGHAVAAIAVARVPGPFIAGQMVIHLRIQGALCHRLLQ